MKKQLISLILCVLLMLTLVPVSVFARNTEGAQIIKNVNIFDLRTPYTGETPDYDVKLGDPNAYIFNTTLDDDPDIIEGKWWYDETSKRAISPDETFIEGHVYTFTVLLFASEGYEFWVDNENTPFIKGYVNNIEACIIDDLTSKKQALVEYTFEPCDYNYEITEVEIVVEDPVAGGYPHFDVEILTDAVVKDETESPYCIESVAWYDCVNQTFLDPSHTFKEDGVYEVNVFLTTVGDFYFATDNNMTDVKAIVNGKVGEANTAGKNDEYHIHVSCVVYGDARKEVSYVEITNIKEPSIGANPLFTATPVKNEFSVTGVFWTDVTESSAVSMKETDEFLAGHTYKLEVWIRANDKYKFSTDEDDYVDIMALVGGHQADVMIPGSEIAAELALTFTLSDETIVSFVDVIDVDAPVAGRTPDYDAFCTTRGCNVSAVEWYDITDGKGTLMTEDTFFEAGRKYKVIVRVDAEGNYTYETDDIDANVAVGNINGQKAVAYSSYDNTCLELGLDFAPCEGDVTPTGVSGDVDGNSTVNVKDATAIQKHVASIITLSDTALLMADVDSSGGVNVKDATAIQKWVAGIETGFAIGQPV